VHPDERSDPVNAVIETTNAHAPPIFSRVLVGIDRSEESREAARQAAILADGELTLFASYDVAHAIGGTGTHVPGYLDEDVQRDAATDALERARDEVAIASLVGKVVRGHAASALISEAEREQNTLIVVGSHGHGRLAGFVMGSTVTEVIHKAPCSVLVARGKAESGGFPNRIVVGVDGSSESVAAYAVARRLSERFGAEVLPIVAHGGKAVDRAVIDLTVDSRTEEVPDEPIAALLAAAENADLLIVGSRGLHGLNSLGSVSERVAHQAQSSVLVVRDTGSLRVSQA
jgi:nucleotide-binding universal stress UspA family protein